MGRSVLRPYNVEARRGGRMPALRWSTDNLCQDAAAGRASPPYKKKQDGDISRRYKEKPPVSLPAVL